MGVAISGLITVFVANRTIHASERNVKLVILDRQYEALRAAVEQIAQLTQNATSFDNIDEIRTKCLTLLILLSPDLSAHRDLKKHIDVALRQQPGTDWGITFLDLAQQALAQSIARKQ
jgi:hypothetical protein